MPWWSWVLIWTGLVLVLLGMLAFFAITLFRKAMRTLGALEDLGRAAELDPRADETEPETERFTPAVFRSRRELLDAVRLRRAARARRRQRRRDRLFQRSKLSTYAPLNQRTEPHA